MKILIATDSFLPRWDGIARFLDEILPYLSKKFNITVVAPDFGKSSDHKVKIVKMPLGKITVAHYRAADVDKKQLRELVRSHDVIFTQTIGPIGYYAIKYGRKEKKKVVSFIHSIEWSLFSKSLPLGQRIMAFFLKKMIPLVYRRSSLLVCPSVQTKDLLNRRKVGKNYVLVHLGVNLKQFKPGRSTKKKLGLQDNTVIGYLGRTGREKDLDTLYKAFRKLYEKNKKIRLLIVGGDVQWSDMRGIVVVKSVDDPERYYRAMDIYVLPSLTETTSLTTLEAMATGLPVLVTPVGHINIYINDRRNGMLFPKGDEEYLQAELEELITNKRMRKRLGKAGRKTASKYSWKETAKELEKVLGND